MNGLQDGGVTPQRVRAVLDEVLARPEFQERHNFLADLLRDFLHWLQDIFGGLGGGLDAGLVESGLRIFWIGVSVVGGIVLVWFWVSFLRSRRKRAASDPEPLADELASRVASLRERAREAQAAGDWTRALRLYFFALVVGLGQRGELAYDDAWTNRELLERGHPSPAVLELLGPLVGELDAHSFGLRPTNAREVSRFAGLCDRLLGGGGA